MRLPSAVCHTFLTLSSLFLIAAAPSTLADEPASQPEDAITQGIVHFDISYEDVGPMAAMLPTSERLLFRPGQVRIESGMNTVLRGVVPGKVVQMMDVSGHKLAFLLPADEPEQRNELLRFESLEGRRSIAGLTAQQVDGVDREDETNRLTYWVTDRVDAAFRAEDALPGFALEYSQPMEDGLAHRVATQVETKTLGDELFVVPADFERIAVDSGRDIGRHLSKVLGGDVKVVE